MSIVLVALNQGDAVKVFRLSIAPDEVCLHFDGVALCIQMSVKQARDLYGQLAHEMSWPGLCKCSRCKAIQTSEEAIDARTPVV